MTGGWVMGALGGPGESWPNALLAVTVHFSTVGVDSPGQTDDLSLPLLPYCVKSHC